MADIYSVVDLSKKKKKKCPEHKEEQEYSMLKHHDFHPETDQNQPHTVTLDSPVAVETDYYNSVDLSKKKRNCSDHNESQEYAVLEQHYFKPEADQNQAHAVTLSSPGSTPAVTGISVAKLPGKEKEFSKRSFSVAAFGIISAVLVAVLVICLVTLFVEVNKLKSERAPDMQQSVVLNRTFESRLLRSQLDEQLSQLNTNFSVFINSHLDEQLSQLSANFTAFINSLLDEQLSQFSTNFSAYINSEVNSIQLQLNNHLELVMSNSTNEVLEMLFNENKRLELWLNTSLDSLGNRMERLEMRQAAVRSCSDLVPSSPSGYYWARTSNGSAVRVYCDMSRSCGGVTGGWMRVAELDMTNRSHQCPSGLMKRTIPIRTCVSSSSSAGCSSDIIFETYGISYSRVCGQVIGYQIGHTNAFASGNESISEAYVDGVSLTHGSPRQHIWTFAAARDARSVESLDSKCSCITNGMSEPPQFVGNDYFCDTGGSNNRDIVDDTFYSSPLWDAVGCSHSNHCCGINTSPSPWFYKQLPQPTTDNIDMRLCRDELQAKEDVAILSVNIYVF